jgi:hypothetical protein
LGHVWVSYTATYQNIPRLKFKGYNVTVICDKCGTLKHFMLSMRGDYYPATYTYADNYLLPVGYKVTREDKGNFKLEALAEALGQVVIPVEDTTVTPISRSRKKQA